MAFRIHTFSRAAWQFYTEMLQQHPVKTKGLTCGFCTVIGDFFTQDRLRTKFQHLMPENTSDADNNKTSSHSFSRSIKLFLYGTLLLGPSLHYWFRTLDKLLPSSGCHKVIFQQGTRSSLWKNYFNSSRLVWSAKRVLVEQASYSLFVTSMYLFTMGSLDYIWNEETFVQWHRTEYTNYQEMIANKFNDDFQSTHFHVMKYFPISNFVNFLVIPPLYRGLFINLMGVFYNVGHWMFDDKTNIALDTEGESSPFDSFVLKTLPQDEIMKDEEESC